MSAEGRHLWRPKANFEGAKPPHGHCGGCWGAVAPPQKELFAIAKSGTLEPESLMLLEAMGLSASVDSLRLRPDGSDGVIPHKGFPRHHDAFELKLKKRFKEGYREGNTK